MIKFKSIRYRDQEEALELSSKIRTGEATQKELTVFVMGLIEDWDYKDVDTQEPIPGGQPGALTLAQFGEVMQTFNAQMSTLKLAIPKASASPSSSGLTKSKAGRK